MPVPCPKCGKPCTVPQPTSEVVKYQKQRPVVISVICQNPTCKHEFTVTPKE